MTLTTFDLMTPDEAELSFRLASTLKNIDELKKENKKKKLPDFQQRFNDLRARSRNIAYRLNTLIESYPERPRKVLLSNVNTREYQNQPYVTWESLKFTRRIAEFSSEESRAMGLKKDEVTFDKIILKWKTLEILRQVVMHGFTMPVLINGEIVEKHYRFTTASAGQLRTDKIQCLSVDKWNEIEARMTCGMTIERINAHGGINVNKLLAYLALPSSATDPWDFDIDRCIVVKDMITPVTGMMDFINPDYTITRGVKTVDINHGDGVGMMLPTVSRFCKMVRGPWLKGLLAPFDFIRFCAVHGVEPVIEDIWHKKYDLVKDDIQVIFTESQLKLAGYYDSWDDYKNEFKRCGCMLCHTNFEESYIPDTEINYQMLQTLQTPTEEELEAFTQPLFDKIRSIGKDKASMLNALDADASSFRPDKQALALYPPLLRDEYFHESLRNVKRRWTLDAKSGRIRCANKRLFVVPDMYAMCEYYFLHDEHPEGLLKNLEVAARPFRGVKKVDCLRSPHLYMEHAIRTVVDDDRIYEWFTSNAIYVSVHDLISRILQFDCDGDQLNVVSVPFIVECAEREIKQFDIVPLFYDAEKAPKSKVTQEEYFNGLKRAHEFSFIGEVSNSLCRLWNRPGPNMKAAAFLCYYNNQIIDAAKTGKINSYESYGDVCRMINTSIGGKTGKMPWFFQFSKNGRKLENEKSKVMKPTLSTMDRICAIFSKVGNITMNYDSIPAFNWKMLLSNNEVSDDNGAFDLFCKLDDEASAITMAVSGSDSSSVYSARNSREYHKNRIVNELESRYGSIENVYPVIVKNLFSGKAAGKITHKQSFWMIFGTIAVENIKHNISNSTVCHTCGANIPAFDIDHQCSAGVKGMFVCDMCGKLVPRKGPKQKRCSACQETTRIEYKKEHNRNSYLKTRNTKQKV